MGRYAIRRLLQMVPVVLGAILLIYIALYIVPGDPVQALVGERPVTPAFRNAIIEKYGLEDPLHTRVGKYLGNLARGDLGESALTRRPVSTIIRETAPNSLRLAGAGAFFLILLGITSGMISAVKRYSVLDTGTTVIAVILVSIPVFVLGLLLQLFALRTQGILGLPITGLVEFPRSYILPGFTLASVSMAYLSRIQRTTLIETLDADYVRTARSKGLRERRVIFNHAWRNSLIPVVTFVGLDIGTFLGGAILTETVFNINGLGRAIFLAVSSRDNQVVLGISIFVVLVYLVVNLIVDLCYAILDPRIRYE